MHIIGAYCGKEDEHKRQNVLDYAATLGDVPIVIGALIAVVVLVVLIFFIVRRKKSQNKYDCDKTDQSENKKLNEEEA